jgi:hypothetical protein
MRKKQKEISENAFLVSMILYAISEQESILKRPPGKKEILDYLFSASRDDPEARELERKLDKLLSRSLAEWEALEEWGIDEVVF